MFFESVIAWLTFWAVLTLILLMTVNQPSSIRRMTDPQKRESAFWEYITNFISFLHAATTVVVSIILIRVNGLNYIGENTEGQNSLLHFSVAYFINDLIFGIWKRYNNKEMNLHHLIGIFSFGYMALKNTYADNACWCYVVTEFSNPIFLLSKIFDHHEGHEHKSKILSIVFAFTFILCRSYIASFFVYEMQLTSVCLFLKLQSGLICTLIRASLDVLVMDYH